MSGKESGTQMNQPHPQGLLREGFEDEGTRATTSFPGLLFRRYATGPLKGCVTTQTCARHPVVFTLDVDVSSLHPIS